MDAPKRYLHTFRQLQNFATVAQLGSFVEASKVLHVTPAALSISIRDLETLLGFRLLNRTTRSVSLTDAGLQYLNCVERILAELRTSELCAHDLKTRGSGIVRIATTQLITLTLLLPALVAIRKQHPEIQPLLLTIPADQGPASVETGQADIAISTQIPSNDNVGAFTLFRSQVHFVCDNRHRFARRKSIRWGEIATEHLVFVKQTTRLRILAQLPAHLIASNTYDAGNFSAALAMVASGFGSAICAGYVKPITHMHKLRAIPLEEPAIVRSVALFTMNSTINAPLIELHRKLLAEHFSCSPNQCIEDRLNV